MSPGINCCAEEHAEASGHTLSLETERFSAQEQFPASTSQSDSYEDFHCLRNGTRNNHDCQEEVCFPAAKSMLTNAIRRANGLSGTGSEPSLGGSSSILKDDTVEVIHRLDSIVNVPSQMYS